jgi:glycosyltransferase involved in cell wall biosynthesis
MYETQGLQLISQLISIIIPTYNRAFELKRALDSVLAQTYSHWEVLIIDNHSSDGTKELIESYDDGRLKLFKIHNDGVIAASRNMGIKHAKGEFIAFLDSDDWWKVNKLKKSLVPLTRGMDIVYHNLLLVYKLNQKILFRTGYGKNIKRPAFKYLIIEGNQLETSSVVVRTKILKKAGGFSEQQELVAWEDYDLWLRISKITEKFQKINGDLGYYWIGGGNVSNPKLNISNLKAFENIYSKELSEFCHGKEPWWIIYGKGRSLYLIQNYEASLRQLMQLNVFSAPLIVIVKSMVMRFFMYFNNNA